MTVQCITCQHFSMRESARAAYQGFGHCAKAQPYEYMSAVYKRICQSHVQHDESAIAARKAWLEGRR